MRKFNHLIVKVLNKNGIKVNAKNINSVKTAMDEDFDFALLNNQYPQPSYLYKVLEKLKNEN